MFLPIYEVDTYISRVSISEGYMNAVSNDYSAIIESIQKSNDLLRMMAAAKLSIDDKIMKADVTSKFVAGIGEHVDVSA